jgi:2-iminobutanoate/2-iminopropanoate deaminase
MQRNVIATDAAPAAIGPYSQGIGANGFIFLSGQIALSPGSADLPTGIEAQTHQVLKNIQAALQAGGSDLARIVKATVFLTDIDHFTTVNNIYAKYFSDTFPARSAVEVSALPRGALVEIEVIALT